MTAPTNGLVPVPVSALVEDWAVYPRTEMSPQNVSKIKLGMEANISRGLDASHGIPPIIADRETLKITDGWHRREAYRSVLGKDAIVYVELRDYETSAAMLLDASRLNAGHGLGLQEIEKKRLVLRLEVLGVGDGDIAEALHVPEDRVLHLRIQSAIPVNDDGTPAVNPDGTPKPREPLKFSMNFLQGKDISASQIEAHKSAPGSSWLVPIGQLRKGLEAEPPALPAEDDRVVQALLALAEAIKAFLAGSPGPAVVTS